MLGVRAHRGLGVHAEEREGEEDGLVAIADVAVAQHADAVRGGVAAQHRRVGPTRQAKKKARPTRRRRADRRGART